MPWLTLLSLPKCRAATTSATSRTLAGYGPSSYANHGYGNSGQAWNHSGGYGDSYYGNQGEFYHVFALDSSSVCCLFVDGARLLLVDSV